MSMLSASRAVLHRVADPIDPSTQPCATWWPDSSRDDARSPGVSCSAGVTASSFRLVFIAAVVPLIGAKDILGLDDRRQPARLRLLPTASSSADARTRAVGDGVGAILPRSRGADE